MMSEEGRRFNGEMIIRSIANMRERSNGLGGGFAAYGIYPDHAEQYAVHVMFDDLDAKHATETVLNGQCLVYSDESMPIRPIDEIRSGPILHRYFVDVKPEVLKRNYDLTEEDIVVDVVMNINANVDGAFVFSSGKNMGVFKGVGYPEDIGRYFRLEEYEAYIWLSHGRFPTNTTGWWGGAHPFGILDWSIVHNGEISSYGINRRYLTNFGYHCTLQTDTEVVAYLFDLLVRRHKLSFEAACMALAPPFWSRIDRMEPEKQRLAKAIRAVYGGALLNGPFSVLVGHRRGILGLNDRIKLRPMVAGRKDDMLYIASEEGAIREVAPELDTIWHAEGGVPIIGELKEGVGDSTSAGSIALEPAAGS